MKAQSFRLVFIYCFILCWPLFLYWLVFYLFTILWGLYVFFLCGGDSLAAGLFYVCTVFAFLVRIPIFMVHL